MKEATEIPERLLLNVQQTKQMDMYPLLVFGVPLIAVLALVAAAIWVTSHRRWSTVPTSAIVVATVPGLAMLISFYALALHMYLALGGWPESIGTQGFPAALVRHADFDGYVVSVLLIAFLALPVWLLVFASVARLQRYIPHLIIGGVAYIMCFIAMQLGPSGFLYWWWD